MAQAIRKAQESKDQARSGSLLGFAVLGSRPLGALLLANMALNLANALHEMGASWDGREIPLHRRYLRVPMGHWPWRSGCHCPKCHQLLFERSKVGWCIMCGSFGCSWCCSVVEYRIKHLRTSAERAIGANWNCATWGLVLRGRPCASGWRNRAVHLCDDMSCRRKYQVLKERIDHKIALQLEFSYWK